MAVVGNESTILPRTIRWSRTALVGSAIALASLAAAAEKEEKQKAGDALVVGKVTDVHGKPLAEVQITVRSERDPELRAQATSDAAGGFKLPIAAAQGQYTFHLEAEGYAPLEGSVELKPGTQIDLDFKLLDAASAARQEAVQTFNAGVDAFNQQQLDSAEQKFLRVLELQPELAEPHQALAELYLRQSKLEPAASAILKFLALRGDDPRARELAGQLARLIYNEAVTALRSGAEERALEQFQRAAELDPELAPAHASSATLLFNRRRYDQAQAALDRLERIEPESVPARRLRYLILMAKHEQERAQEALEAYIAADPAGAAEMLYQRAELDFREDRREPAIAALERVLQLQPQMARAHYTLGLCYVSRDDAKARQHLGRFVELAPDDPEAPTARELLGQLK
ncbi:MAG TPA: tetratricopeptide repeat protein [Acidobacteriota bacterium]